MPKILIYLLTLLILNSCTYKEKDEMIYGKEIFHDIEARKAIAYSINKEALTNDINRRNNEHLFTTTDSIFINTKPIIDNTYNQDKALYYWSKIKERYNFDNVIIEAYTFNYVIEINKDLEHLGITDLYIKPMGFSVGFNYMTAKANQSDIYYDGYYIDDPIKFLEIWLPNGKKGEHIIDGIFGNYVGWFNQDYNNIIKNIKCGYLEDNQELKEEAIYRAERILLKEYVLIPLFYRDSKYLIYLTFNLEGNIKE